MSWSKFNVVIAVGATAFIALQWSQIVDQKNEIALLQNKVDQTSQQRPQPPVVLSQPVKQEAPATRQIIQLQRENAKLAARNASLRAQIDAAPPPGIGDDLLALVTKDPDAIKAIQEMQAQEIKKQYAPLVKQLNLTPDQRDMFYTLLINDATNSAVMGLQFLTSTNSADSTNFEAGVAAAKDALDQQIQLLLGANGAAQYEEFKSSMEDREMLAQLQDSFSDNPLTDDQQQRLLQVMTNARKSVEQSSDEGVSPPTNTASALAQMNQSLQAQVQINQQVYQQAAAFLSPEQLQSLAAGQSNLLAQDQLGVTLGQKFLAPGSNEVPSVSFKFTSRTYPGSQ